MIFLKTCVPEVRMNRPVQCYIKNVTHPSSNMMPNSSSLTPLPLIAVSATSSRHHRLGGATSCPWRCLHIGTIILPPTYKVQVTPPALSFYLVHTTTTSHHSHLHWSLVSSCCWHFLRPQDRSPCQLGWYL